MLRWTKPLVFLKYPNDETIYLGQRISFNDLLASAPVAISDSAPPTPLMIHDVRLLLSVMMSSSTDTKFLIRMIHPNRAPLRPLQQCPRMIHLTRCSSVGTTPTSTTRPWPQPSPVNLSPSPTSSPASLPVRRPHSLPTRYRHRISARDTLHLSTTASFQQHQRASMILRTPRTTIPASSYTIGTSSSRWLMSLVFSRRWQWISRTSFPRHLLLLQPFRKPTYPTRHGSRSTIRRDRLETIEEPRAYDWWPNRSDEGKSEGCRAEFLKLFRSLIP